MKNGNNIHNSFCEIFIAVKSYFKLFNWN